MAQTITPIKKIKLSNFLASLLILLSFLVGFSSGIIYSNKFLIQPAEETKLDLSKVNASKINPPKALTVSAEELQEIIFRNTENITFKRQSSTTTIGGVLQSEGYREYSGDSKYPSFYETKITGTIKDNEQNKSMYQNYEQYIKSLGFELYGRHTDIGPDDYIAHYNGLYRKVTLTTKSENIWELYLSDVFGVN